MKVGDLVRCTHGSGSGTVGIIVALKLSTEAPGIVRVSAHSSMGTTGTYQFFSSLAQLNNGEHYSTDRLEVISASR
jgi:hypothetical protein